MKTLPIPPSIWMVVFLCLAEFLLLTAPMGCGRRFKAAFKNALILVY